MACKQFLRNSFSLHDTGDIGHTKQKKITFRIILVITSCELWRLGLLRVTIHEKDNWEESLDQDVELKWFFQKDGGKNK